MLQRINTEIGKRYILTVNYNTPTTEYLYDPYMNVIGTLPSARDLVDIEFLATYNEYFIQTKGYSDPMVVNTITLKEIPNLISNGTFESGITGWGFRGTGTWETGSNKISGNGSAKITQGGSTYTNINFTTAVMAVGRKYRVSFSAKLLAGSDLAGKNLNFYRGLGASNGGTTQTITSLSSMIFGQTYNFSFDYENSPNIDSSKLCPVFETTVGTTGLVIVFDNIHIYEISEWISSGNHSIDWTTRDKYTNSGSLLIISTGSGDTGSNYVSLPYANFDTLESTKKYTLEFWSKVDPSTLTYGNNLVTNGADWVDSDADGIPDGWNKNIGTETFSILTESGSTYLRIPRVHGYDGMSWGGLTTNRIYKVSYKVRGDAPYRTYFNSNNEITHLYPASTSSWESITDYGLLVGTGIYITLNSATPGKYLEIDDVMIQQATLVPYITASLGSKLVNSSILNPNSWIKTVLNFEAGSTELNQNIKLNLNQSCSVYVDKLSLSQRYDLGFFAKFRIESGSWLYPTLFTYGGVGSAGRGDLS